MNFYVLILIWYFFLSKLGVHAKLNNMLLGKLVFATSTKAQSLKGEAQDDTLTKSGAPDEMLRTICSAKPTKVFIPYSYSVLYKGRERDKYTRRKWGPVE